MTAAAVAAALYVLGAFVTLMFCVSLDARFKFRAALMIVCWPLVSFLSICTYPFFKIMQARKRNHL